MQAACLRLGEVRDLDTIYAARNIDDVNVHRIERGYNVEFSIVAVLCCAALPLAACQGKNQAEREYKSEESFQVQRESSFYS